VAGVDDGGNGNGVPSGAPDSQRPGLARCGPDDQQQLGSWATERTPGVVSESPLEEALRRAFLRTPYFSTPRVPMDRIVGVGPCGLLLQQLDTTIAKVTYRLDFALVNFAAEVFIGVEVDGKHHDRPEQAQRDRMRDRALASAGWVLQRFSGVEVHRDAAGCAAEIIRLARRASGLLKLGVSA
jgi:hypothetical protein